MREKAYLLLKGLMQAHTRRPYEGHLYPQRRISVMNTLVIDASMIDASIYWLNVLPLQQQ